jgi:hypothetical protein
MENIISHIIISIYMYIYMDITYNIISYHPGEIIISFFSAFGCWMFLQPRNSMSIAAKKRAALARDTMSQVVRECRLAVPWVAPTLRWMDSEDWGKNAKKRHGTGSY